MIASVVDPTDSIPHNLFAKFDSTGNMLWSKITGSSYVPHVTTDRQPTSILYNKKDSTIMINNAFGTNVISRIDEDGNGFCFTSNYPVTVTDLPLSVTAGTSMITHFTCTTTPYNLISTSNGNAKISYACQDTTPSIIINPVSVNNIGTSAEVTVFPNQANDVVYFRSDIPMNDAIIELYNAVGTKVAEQAIYLSSKETSISTASLPAGLYIYKVSGDNGLLRTGTVSILRN